MYIHFDAVATGTGSVDVFHSKVIERNMHALTTTSGIHYVHGQWHSYVMFDITESWFNARGKVNADLFSVHQTEISHENIYKWYLTCIIV